MNEAPTTRHSLRSLRLNDTRSRHERLITAGVLHGIPASELMLPAEWFIGGDGVQLHALEWPGPAREPTIVMLHGGGLNASTWNLCASILRFHGRCIAFDLRGHGESERPSGDSGYNYRHSLSDLDAVLDAFDAENVILVGHSLGGLVSLTWAGERRDPRLRGIVAVDIGPDLASDGTDRISHFVARSREFTDLEDAEAQLHLKKGSSAADNLAWSANGRLTWKADPSQFTREAGLIAPREQFLDGLKKIEVPVLVARGERSDILTSEDAASFAESLSDGRWVEIAEAGHNVQRGNPRALSEAIVSFAATLTV